MTNPKEPLSLWLETPSNATNFRYYRLAKGHVLSIDCSRYYHLFFLLEGKVEVSCNEFLGRTISEKQSVLLPINADFLCEVVKDCRIVIFSFDQIFHFCHPYYWDDLVEESHSVQYHFQPTIIYKPLFNLLQNLCFFLVRNEEEPLLYEIKQEEIFIIYQWFYTKNEVVSLFYPLVGKSFDFRKLVLQNYRKVKSVEELAKLCNTNMRTFCRQFKEEFQETPYHWLLNQKAKHVQFSLSETEQTLQQIRQQHGFSFAAHFTRFCREQFHRTPSSLERDLRNKEGETPE